MRRLPPLNALRSFEAAARNLNFKRAADELGVTPTAISHQIKLLEETIGHSLFRRHPRPLALTETGARLFPVIRDSLDNIAQGLKKVSGGSDKKILRVSTTVAFASNLLLPRLMDWSLRHPDLELDIHASDFPVDLASEQIDLAIRYAATPEPGMMCFPLWSDAFYPMAAPGLVGVSADDDSTPRFFHLPLISYRWKSAHEAAPTWDGWAAVANRSKRRKFCHAKSQIIRLSEESHAIQAAIDGQGVVLASSVVVSEQARANKLVPVSDVALPGLTYFLVHRKSQENVIHVGLFRRWLMDFTQPVAVPICA